MQAAQESIWSEGVVTESWFQFYWSGHDYLFAHMRSAEDWRNSAAATELEIDLVHREFKKLWDSSVRIRCTRL